MYTYTLFKSFPLYFIGSDICHKSSFCQQSTVTECILNLLDPSTAGGGQLLFLLILCLQISYWQCLGFRSPKKGMLISVLSPVDYFVEMLSAPSDGHLMSLSAHLCLYLCFIPIKNIFNKWCLKRIWTDGLIEWTLFCHILSGRPPNMLR